MYAGKESRFVQDVKLIAWVELSFAMLAVLKSSSVCRRVGKLRIECVSRQTSKVGMKTCEWTSLHLHKVGHYLKTGVAQDVYSSPPTNYSRWSN